MVRIVPGPVIHRATSLLRPRRQTPRADVPTTPPRPARLPVPDVLLCGVLALVALTSRLAYRVGTLEHWDTVNFVLAGERFDPARHQPHPPGQVLFVGLTRLMRRWTGDDVHAVALTNALLGALALVPFYVLVRRWTDRSTAWLAGLLFVVNPCLWLNSVRPLSDGAALLPLLTAVCLLLSERRGPALLGYPAMGLETPSPDRPGRSDPQR